MAIDQDAVESAESDLISSPAEIQNAAGERIKEHDLGTVDAIRRKLGADDAVATNTKTRGLRFNKFSHRGTTG